MTKLVAITGGIGSGKSTFSKQILRRKLKLLDSDQQVDKIYTKPNNDFVKYLRKIGLEKSIKAKNKIDKRFISKIIFINKDIRHKLQNYIFKIVRKRRSEFIESQKKRGEKVIFFDIPLLLENNLAKDYDLVISIISAKKNRYKRLKLSKKLSIVDFNNIIKTQTTDLDRRKNSDIIILNNNSKYEYIKKINKVLDRILLWEK